jgi:pimeloyl-ACP methyl ester carboxylesterase
LSLTQEEFGVQTAAVSEIRAVPTPGAPALSEGVEECWMDFDGARMRYLRAGSGPPIILLHGLLGYSFSWRYAMPALAPLRTCYAPDMLGAGFSERPKIDHSMRATALRLLRFAENLKLDSFDLVGTSRGGDVGHGGVRKKRQAAHSESCPRCTRESIFGARALAGAVRRNRRWLSNRTCGAGTASLALSFLAWTHVRRCQQDSIRQSGRVQGSAGEAGIVRARA